MPLFYRNPIIHADYADPDILRHQDAFWMVASSFSHVPGLPILHSRDLVHWRLVNYAVPRLPAESYDTVQPGKGIWAPSIRFHGGRFWIFFSMPDEGIFVCHSTDPLGEWSKPHCLIQAAGWIDPCPLWDDDGRAWLVHAFAYSRSGIKNKLQLIEMAPDASRLLDGGRIIFDGTLSHPTLEGPKLYKRSGEYWIFAPAGGVKRGWQTVLRAKNLAGPWQSRDVLHQSDTPINGPHQGGWVALENGEQWFVHFQDKGVYGRVVHLQPLRWLEDGWPLPGEVSDEPGKGRPVLYHALPALPCSPCAIQTSDDFNDGHPGLQWQWQANPHDDWIIPGHESLTLCCKPLGTYQGKGVLYATPQLLLQKFPAARFTVCCEARADFRRPGDEGGLVVFGERYAALTIRQNAHRGALIFRSGWMSDNGTLCEQERLVGEMDEPMTLALACDVGDDGICRFRYRAPHEDWRWLAPSFAAGAGKWVGAKIGLYGASPISDSPGAIQFGPFTVTIL
ncbi:glycoside hydrolase family 43 protein [Martelella alba]|uniref:Glycosyl hydrolase 43 family protein n=1 Tax=Martelella alba TaxID=2590451 RepID=A0ABY2SPQ8_9HYPH|nr:glycoside hydrolase 43 family protein [Martelella alba]TKI07666.1 glycosyl hydrolase 43 family protein [Martelella alba]